MNLTPANWKKSEVTENKQYIKSGMRLFTPNSGPCKVLEINGEDMKIRLEEDETDEFDEWFDMNDLQIGWSISRKDLEFIEAVKNH